MNDNDDLPEISKTGLKDTHRWKPGQSGNPKGRPKESFSRPNLLKRSRQLKIFPEDVLLHFVAGDHKALNLEEGDITPNMRLKATTEAMKKLVPDLKAVEFNTDLDQRGGEGEQKSVVILPSNSRELIEDDYAEVIPVEDLSKGIKEAIEVREDDTED